MIRTIKIEINAAFPNMPLVPFNIYHNSAAAVTILNVPRRIVSVALAVKNVSGTDGVFAAQRSGSAWIVTIPGEFFAQSGTSTRGVKVEGVDEAGNVFILGAADLIVMLDNGSVEPVQPGGDGDMKHSEFLDLEVPENMTQKQSNELIETIVRKLKGTASLVALVFGLTSLALPASAEITPDTEHGDISPTAKLSSVVHAAVDGAARPLPPYLHYIEMDDTYPEAAAEWYAQADYSGERASRPFSCSAVRSGNTLSRNYDWTFDFMPEFVVRCVATAPSPSCPAGRFASLAVCNVGTNLTEADVSSGKWSKWYKALPGHAVDGINENGVACEINVVDGAPAWDGGASPALHPLAAVRWVLDNATNALQAATYIASHIAFPQGWAQNFHYMVADETSTYIVENGTAYPSGGTGVSPVPVITNFRLYPTRDTTGEGQERYDALASGANITSQWWTLTYTPTGYRASDLPGITGEALTQLFNYWGNNPRESHRGERFGTMTWWQTVHTSIYDITNRTLRIAVQETDDWYVFAIPGGTGVSPVQVRAIAAEVVAPVASDLEMKIDRTGDQMNGELDMDYNDLSNVGSMNVSSLSVEDELDVESADVHFGGALTVDGKSTLGEVSAEQIDATHLVASGTVKAGSGLQVGQTDVMQEIGGKIGKVLSAINGNFAVFSNGSVADGGLSPGDVTGAIAGKRDVDDLLVYGLSADYASVTFEVTSDREIIAGTYTTDDGVLWVNFGNATRIRRNGTVFTLSDEFEEIISTSWTGVPATGTIRIGTTTASFGVNAYHDRIAKESMISATDPAFSNAVLAVGLNIDTNSVAVLNEIAATFGDFPITGTATTVGGLLAALAAAVAWLRKRAAHLESDGTADDDFANDLLGKSVAKAAIAYSLKTGADAMTDRAVKTYDGTSAQVDVTFPTDIPVGITDFEAWIKMGATVQTVTYPDDDYTIEWKDGKVPTSADYKASATNVVHFTIVKESETATPIVTAILAGFMAATPAA